MEERHDPYVMYLVVRKSLKMNMGKTAASVGHAVQMLMQQIMPDHRRDMEGDEYDRIRAGRDWLQDDYPSYAKIVLGATDEEFEAIKDAHPHHFLVVDRGFAAVPTGSETCIGLWPVRKSQAHETVKNLPLLR